MEQTLEFTLPDEAATSELGRRLAGLSRRGDVFALSGTLGMGKSVLARAFIQQLCGAAEVPSPTFTLVQTYSAPDFEIYHFDLYRLKTAEEIFELGIEDAMYQAVCLIEWPEKMRPYVPFDAIWINFASLSSGGRKITISSDSPEKWRRLAELEKKQ